MRNAFRRFCAALIPLALCAALLAGCGGTSDTARIADAYVGGFTRLYEQGNLYTEQGLQIQADYAYGFAAASACAMRYAVEHLLSLKGEGRSAEALADGRPADWDAIAAMNYASPYPWYFQGLVCGALGREDEARTCYEMALLNPAFSAEHDEALSTLLVLSVQELKQLREKLAELEDAVFAVYEPDRSGYPREALGFSDVYLRALARESLQADPGDARGALRHYEAALRVNPFEGDNFVGCALMSLELEDMDRVFYYVNEGLFVDPEHEGLLSIAAALNGGA